MFLLLQFISGLRPRVNAVPITPFELAAIEALKLASNILIRYRSGDGLFSKPQDRTALWNASQDIEHPLQGLAGQDSDGSVVSSREDVYQEHADADLTMRSCLAVLCASAVWAGAAYTVRCLTDRMKDN